MFDLEKVGHPEYEFKSTLKKVNNFIL